MKRAKPKLLIYPAKSIDNAKQVRHILSPPEGRIPYSNFRLYQDDEEISF